MPGVMMHDQSPLVNIKLHHSSTIVLDYNRMVYATELLLEHLLLKLVLHVHTKRIRKWQAVDYIPYDNKYWQN